MIILLAILSVYCITHFLTDLDGPFGIFYKLRRLKGFGALNCFSCTSPYVAVVVALVALLLPSWVLYPFAFAGGVIIIHRLLDN